MVTENNKEDNVDSVPNIIRAASRNRRVVVRVVYRDLSKRSGLGIR